MGHFSKSVPIDDRCEIKPMGNFVNDICINNVTYIYSIIKLRTAEVFPTIYSSIAILNI